MSPEELIYKLTTRYRFVEDDPKVSANVLAFIKILIARNPEKLNRKAVAMLYLFARLMQNESHKKNLLEYLGVTKNTSTIINLFSSTFDMISYNLTLFHHLLILFHTI